MTPRPPDPAPSRPKHSSGAAAVLRALWTIVSRGLVTALNILLALILLFEEWGWRPLVRAVAWLARFRIVARLEAAISDLPPYPSLAVFALPSLILFPVKIFGLWLLASGQVLLAGALLLVAKVVSTALVARLFMLTRPALLQIAWFKRLYDWFMPWKEALFAYVRASFVWRYGRVVKSRIKQLTRRLWSRWRPRLIEAARAARARSRIIWQRWFPTRD
ncbi:MAG: hypothetical protein R3D27_15325 [Hyphomicrobiaceae bacterium]